MTPATVYAAHSWPSNAELIADCARLGYLKPDDLVLDPTYRNGTWWKAWRPDRPMVTNVLEAGGWDFRSIPWPDDHFDAVTFDPPYVSTGGRTTSTIDTFNATYGLSDTPRTPAGLQCVIDDGLAECHRVVKPAGIVLVKCADYISSGRLWLGTHRTLTTALALGFEAVDRLEMVGRCRPQPERSRRDGQPVVQQHARRNLSTLFVLRKAR